MAYIIETPNPFQPLTGIKKHQHPGGITIRQWLQVTYPGFIEFENPTVCIVNGDAVMRKDWDRTIQSGDVVNFIGVVGYDVIAIIVIIVLVIAIAVSIVLALNIPQTPGEVPSSDPVFSVKGQTNQIRLGEPIEANYGKCRIYPSIAQRPAFRYIHNEQYMDIVLCIGQGLYDIHQILIGDTDIDEYDGTVYEVIEPGDTPTLFRTNVYTAPEVGGQTLFAPNEPEFVPPNGFIGPFVTNPAGTQVTRIDIDLVWPRGVYHQKKKTGELEPYPTTVRFQYREIDDDGNPVGGGVFNTLFEFTLSGPLITPQRRTRINTVAAGRYEVRGRYVGLKDELNNRTAHQVTWEAMKGFIKQDPPDFGNVTILAARVKATNNLNSRTQERFNVIATRKLPIYESGGWSEPVPTRSIVWAFCDVFRAEYGARILDDRFLDLAALQELDALYAERGDFFDWSFRDPITVWEAARAIARAGRAAPLLSGSLITMKRDGPLEVPVTLFSPDNIIQGTFTWDIKLWEPNDFDSVSVEYTDPDTGYRQENLLCILPSSDATGDNPEDLRMPGVSDRNQAYREGLYYLATKRYLRENFTFETGMEGFIPTFGDLVAVSHDVPNWDKSGYVVAKEDAGPNTVRLLLSQPVEFVDSDGYQILFRGRQAEVIGPLDVFPTSDPKVVLVTVPEDSEEIDFLLGGQTEPMLFLFGVIGRGTKYGKVVKIEPLGGERIRMTVASEEPIIHSFDELEAPPIDTTGIPPEVPDLPTISHLTLSQVDGDLLLVQASWTAAFGAQYYLVETSYVSEESDPDNEAWEPKGQTTRTSLQFQVNPGTVRVRVAAVNNGKGPWIEDEIQIGLIAGLSIYKPWNDLEWGVSWWPKINADGWLVRIYDNTDPDNPVLKRSTQNLKNDLDFDYTYTMAVTDGNLHRNMLVKVDTLVLNEQTGELEEDGFPGELTLTNAVPAQPIHLGYESFGNDESGTVGFVYRLFWDNPAELDLYKVKIWVSKVDISAFDEDAATLVFQATASPSPGYTHLPEEAYIVIPDEFDGGHDQYFWWVAVFDVWGNEITSNISDPAILPEVVPPIGSNLVAHWKLDETSGNRADSEGSNTLTDVNTVGSAGGVIGNAASFVKASSESLTIADNAALSMGDIDFTIAGWVWFDSLSPVQQPVSKYESIGDVEYLLDLSGTHLRFLVSGDGSTFGGTVTDTHVTIGTGAWHFCVIWHDSVNNTINISVDDNTPVSAAWSGGVFNGAASFRLGRGAFDGRLDSWSVWKRILSAGQRTYMYNSGSGRDYPF